MHQAIYDLLVDVARTRGAITYAELAPLAAIDLDDPGDRAALAAILDEINVREHNGGRPMLSATVVLAGSNRPGQGFFACAERLGEHIGADRLAYWQRERERLYTYWAST